MGGRGFRSTLCWDCSNARATKCPWIGKHKPMLDWWEEYKETVIYASTNDYASQKSVKKPTKSFQVIRCKNFIRDGRG